MGLKNRTLLVFKYLWMETDEEHTVSLEQLKAYLENRGLSRPDSRTLKNDIAQLMELGIDIVKDRRVQNQYFIAARHFDTAEVKLLIDAVQSSKFITPHKSKSLIKKLAAFIAPYQKRILKRELYIDYQPKAGNEAVIRIVDHIYSAIASKNMVRFQYFEYTPEKQKIHRHEGQYYAVSPYAMIWSNDLYYMVGYSETQQLIATYRIDRIDGLEITEEPSRERPADFSISDYFGQTFSMFSGENCRVELLCENELMGSIIDRFGEDVQTEVVDDAHFKADVTIALSSVFYGWVFASAGKMRILSPPKVVREFEALLGRYITVEKSD